MAGTGWWVLVLVPALVMCVAMAEYKEPPPDTANQVHLSLTKSPTEMMVTWSTPGPVPDTSVVYGLASDFPQLKHLAQGTQTKFVDNGTLHHTQYIHRVVMDGLIPGEKYVYRVRNGTEYGRLFSFNAMKASEKWENPRFTVYGDFGVDNPRSLPHLIEETMAGLSDIVVHTGDYAYDDWKDNSTWADLWLNMVEPVAAYLPYMVCPGNHEGLYDFLNYRSRFTMPDFENENLFFSWDAGNTHWIAYDTEVYFVYEAMEGHGGVHRNFGPYPDLAQRQLEFIEQDLKEANLPENRAKRPWIITYGHRPMYCSDNDDDDCVLMRNQWKQGLEDLFYKYHVDFVIEAHQHTYERLWPVYNGVVYNGSAEAPYTNPGAPVHIVAGAAGCEENLDTFGPPLGTWSALRLAAYGYGHLNIHNATHAHWEQLDVSNYSVVDEIWVVKDKGHTSWGPNDPTTHAQGSLTIS